MRIFGRHRREDQQSQQSQQWLVHLLIDSQARIHTGRSKQEEREIPPDFPASVYREPFRHYDAAAEHRY